MRYELRGLGLPDGSYVPAFDYDAMDSAATALGAHVQFLEARVKTLEAALTEIADHAQANWSGPAAREWLLSYPEKHAAMYSYSRIAREALATAPTEQGER